MTILGSYNGISTFNRRILGVLGAVSLCLMMPVSAAAQSSFIDEDDTVVKMPKESIPASLQSSPAIELDLGRFNESPYLSLSSTLNEAFVPLPPQILDGTNFSTDFSATNCLANQTLCGPRFDNIGVDLSKEFNADKLGGIDLQLIPRASLNFGDEHSSALVGAVVKIGEDLRDINPNDTKKWYLFAGADAEALTFSPQGASRLTAGQFNLQDKIIVGDAQAGFGYKIGDADISLAYIRRDVNSYGLEPGDAAISYTEDAAALSLTWRR